MKYAEINKATQNKKTNMGVSFLSLINVLPPDGGNTPALASDGIMINF